MTVDYSVIVDIDGLAIRSAPKSATSCGEVGANFIIGPITSGQAALASHVASVYGPKTLSPSLRFASAYLADTLLDMHCMITTMGSSFPSPGRLLMKASAILG